MRKPPRVTKMKSKFLALCLGVAALGAAFASSAEASNLDTYRNLLMNRTYTIKYTDITPLPRITNRDSIKIYGKNSMDTSQSAFMLYKQTEGVVVCNGENRYEEEKSGNLSQCRLQKGEDTYVFFKEASAPNASGNPLANVFGGGGKKNKVSPIDTNYTAQVMLGESFGGENLTRYMNALLPDANKGADMPSFRYVDEGWLNNGLNYVDMSAREGEVNEAVRYYFKQYTLVKIAAIRYWRNAQGVFETQKAIIRINEFSGTPDESYLQLPPGVKETKKKKK